jgi:hypothetical protein
MQISIPCANKLTTYLSKPLEIVENDKWKTYPDLFHSLLKWLSIEEE